MPTVGTVDRRTHSAGIDGSRREMRSAFAPPRVSGYGSSNPNTSSAAAAKASARPTTANDVKGLVHGLSPATCVRLCRAFPRRTATSLRVRHPPSRKPRAYESGAAWGTAERVDPW
jgi:hypothetical protein